MNDRFRNQKELIDGEKLANTRFTVIGAGAIGSQVVLGLSKMGARDVTVYDFDTLEDHNFANQMHPISQLGKYKVDSLYSVASDYGDCKIKAINKPWTTPTGPEVVGDRLANPHVVLCCVDNMDVRKNIFDYYIGVDESGNPRADYIVDARMGAFVYKVFGVDFRSQAAVNHYRESLHSQAEAAPEPCGQKSIIYTVFLVSGIVLSQVKEYLCKDYRPTSIIYDAFNHTIDKVYHQELKMNVIEAEEEGNILPQ